MRHGSDRSRASFPSRREFLNISASFGFLGGLGSMGALGRALAQDADFGPNLVRLSPDIEPIVRVIENTPRERVMEAAAGLLRNGLEYKQFMAALYLAGIRNVDSRNAGSRFHCVYVINSAHLLALESPAEERFLPLFWALDDFKGAQASRPRPMGPLVRNTPSGSEAIAALRKAVYEWDQDAAEIALAGMARTCTPKDAFEALWQLGARDFRPIGHKAIFVANTWRTLQTIGWQHAEPAFRSLGQALGHNGTQFENGLPFADQSHSENDELVRAHAKLLPPDWAAPGNGADAVTAAALLAPIRAGNSSSACRDALELMLAKESRGRGVGAGTVWDVVHLAAAEFMLRRGNIGDVHAVTSVNALHYGFRAARTTETRLFLLLQAVGWMAHFSCTGGLAGCPSFNPGTNILELAQPEAAGDGGPHGDAAAAAERIFNTMPTNRVAAAHDAFAYATRHGNDPTLLASARRLAFTRATDTHDLKYPAAAFEDIAIVSPRWKHHMVAASVLHAPAITRPESDAIQRAKEAVKGL